MSENDFTVFACRRGKLPVQELKRAEEKTSVGVVYCPTCHAPVVNDSFHWEQHYLRLPKCRSGL